MKTTLVLSAEHASANIPARYRPWFKGQAAVLQSHRGWDPGTLQLGRQLAKKFQVPLFATTVSRLLIEVNRSLHHPQLFSEFSNQLPPATKQQVIRQYYLPHREAIEQRVRDLLKPPQRVLHVSLHSFTGQWNGQPRNADVGLLYDPRRAGERATCCLWQTNLQQQLPDFVIRRNYPYLGKADGLTTSLRKKFPSSRYLGIEVEVNQKHAPPSQHWARIGRALEATLMELLMLDYRWD
jgi:predicted N-formylglutamate amidohydrolase